MSAGELIANSRWNAMHWQSVPWHGAELDECIFDANVFIDMEWWSCHLDAVAFINTNWSDTTFKECVFTNCRFVNCVFEKAVFKRQQFVACAFENCAFIGCEYLEGAVANAECLDLRIESSSVEKLVMTSNKNVKLHFRDSVFRHLVLTDFDFKLLNHENTTFINLIALECTARDCDFQGVHLMQSQFSDSDMTGSDFSRADLSQACFKGCNLKNSRFTQAVMKQTLMVEANAAQAIFEGAQLECANFSDSNCERAIFRNADMTMTLLHRSHLQYADFSDCNMPFTDFSYSDLSHANFSGGKFMRSKHHAVIDQGTHYGSRLGILAPDHELLRAEQWVKV